MNFSFGFTSMDGPSKTAAVKDVFKRVASAYDVMNDTMSFGLHRCWKKALVESLNFYPQMKILDMAAGTGDISLRLQKEAQSRKIECKVFPCDINESMASEGAKRLPDFSWALSDAAALTFHDSSFDAYVVSFGLRNVTYLEDALKEAHRCLRPGGQFLCLEFSSVLWPFLRELYDIYSFQLIPLMGEIIAKDRHAYQYLVESIRKFPSQKAFSEKLKETGFSHISEQNLSGGIVCLHKAWKI